MPLFGNRRYERDRGRKAPDAPRGRILYETCVNLFIEPLPATADILELNYFL